MEKEQLIKELDLQYSPLLDNAQTAFSKAQAEITLLQGQYAEKLKEINEYFNAIAEKEAADLIIGKGAPKL